MAAATERDILRTELRWAVGVGVVVLVVTSAFTAQRVRHRRRLLAVELA